MHFNPSILTRRPAVVGIVGLAAFVSLTGIFVTWRLVAKESTGILSGSTDGSMPQDQKGSDDPAWLRVHDFGVVRDNVQQLKHLFRVKNDSQIPWTAARIQTGCLCAAATPTKRTILPGEYFELEVGYRPPKEEGMKNQRVIVQFREQGVPDLTFEVRAVKVHGFSVSRENITFDTLAQGNTTLQRIDVTNNSEQFWEGVDLAADVSWLKLAIRSEPPHYTRPWCKQHWVIDVVASSEQLKYGPQTGSITIRPKVEGFEQRVVAVRAVVAPALEVIPSQLFVGEVRRDEQRSFSLLMRFASDVCPDDVTKLEVTHDLGKALTCEINRIPNVPVWVIKFLFEGKQLEVENGYARGIIRLRIHDERIAPVEVPFIARIQS